MKLMKHITIALVLCAIPAMAFGQDVSCDDCTHVVSVYHGEGGLIATADGAEMVTYVATCEGVTRSGELAANADGVVSTLLTMDNGLACSGDDEDNEFQLGPVMDGGWYWITDADNSAVGNLVSMDVLKNDTTDITSAGDGVTMTAGMGAVYLKETSSGRVGILPNILPEMAMEATPATKCGFKGAATGGSPASPVKTECMLGDGGTTLLMTSQNAITGATVRIMDKGSITRPAGDGSVEIVADLWGNGSGHYVTTHDATTANGISAMRGQTAVAMSAVRTATRYTGVTYAVNVSAGGPGTGESVAAGGTPGTGDGAGVSWVDTTTNAATISVGSASSLCSKTANHTATVTLTATMATATDADQVVPSIVRSTTSTPEGRVGSASFMIVCPAASANMGQELVPENPFPTE